MVRKRQVGKHTGPDEVKERAFPRKSLVQNCQVWTDTGRDETVAERHFAETLQCENTLWKCGFSLILLNSKCPDGVTLISC